MINAVKIECWNHDEPLLVNWVDRVKEIPKSNTMDDHDNFLGRIAKVYSARADQMVAQGARWKVRLMERLNPERDGADVRFVRAYTKDLVGVDTLTADNRLYDGPVPDGGRQRPRFKCGVCGQNVPIKQENLDPLIDAFVAKGQDAIPLGALRKYKKLA